MERILETKRKEIERRKSRGLFFRPFWDSPRRDFRGALTAPDFTIIAEIKRASPSKGLLCSAFDPIQLARSYEQGRAGAISVITDEPYFKGSLEYLAAVRGVVELPLLRKDFILDPIQIEEARAFGADAVLLIVAVLSFEELREFLAYARKLELSALVEVHDEEELEIALSAGADIIGINNRNLKTFEVTVETTFRLLKHVPSGVPVISESGLSEAESLKRLFSAGVAGALIGEALVKDPHPDYLLKEWQKALREA